MLRLPGADDTDMVCYQGGWGPQKCFESVEWLLKGLEGSQETGWELVELHALVDALQVSQYRLNVC